MSSPRSGPSRLLRRSDFLHVQAEGRRFRRPHIVLLVSRGRTEEARLGYTVSRKVGNAVIRNRVRRRLRELVRAARDVLVSGHDYVIIANPSAREASFAELEGEVRELLSAARGWVGERARVRDHQQ